MDTVKVDDHKRVRLPKARPGQIFALESKPDGGFSLTPLAKQAPEPAKVRLEKENGYTVLVSDRPFDEAAVKQAFEEFP